MASTYVNDLRLNELGTGDGSGTWGTTTNTNFELIAEALSYGTEAITTNADTHTSTVADGSTDPARSMYIKYTGALDSNCTITIAPNTISRVHIIENATTDSGSSGPYSIIISQGSGANVTIPNGQVSMVYLDGAGSGAAVVDALTDLSIAGTFNAAADIVAAGTLQATGDTAAGDDAAIGFTSAEGLILTGQGSTSDVTIKNDADATVASIATGTTVFTMSDDVTVVGRAIGSTITTENDATYDLATANNFTTTTAGSVTMPFTNKAAGQSGSIKFVNGGNHTVSAHADVAINADVLTALSATGTYFVTYYVTAASGNNTILVGATAILT